MCLMLVFLVLLLYQWHWLFNWCDTVVFVLFYMAVHAVHTKQRVLLTTVEYNILLFMLYTLNINKILTSRLISLPTLTDPRPIRIYTTPFMISFRKFRCFPIRKDDINSIGIWHLSELTDLFALGIVFIVIFFKLSLGKLWILHVNEN